MCHAGGEPNRGKVIIQDVKSCDTGCILYRMYRISNQLVTQSETQSET